MTKDELKAGTYYKGEGRFVGGIAMWTGEEFTGMQKKFGQYLQTYAAYGDDGFTPTEEIIQENDESLAGWELDILRNKELPPEWE